MDDTALISGTLFSVANPAIETPRATADREAAREISESFEAVFLAQMLNQMSAGLKTDGPFGGGFSESIYRSMMNEQYAGTVAQRGGLGIADAVFREILNLQEVDQ